MNRTLCLLTVLILVAPALARAAPGGRDQDGDGIPDAYDMCPTAPEDRDGFQDQDGCPDPDNDKDGIPDVRDKCPNDPENFNGFQDQDGCPDRKRKPVVVVHACPPIRGGITFGRRSARIPKRSIAVLKQVVRILGKYKSVKLVEVQGYADDYRSAKADLRLSLRRAKAICRNLIKRGISAKRLVAKGYGRPHKRGKKRTKAARARNHNRRVLFKILKKTKPGPRKKRRSKRSR